MLIFLPDKAGPNPEHLRQAGLGRLLQPGDEAPSATDLVTAGPGGRHGQIWGWLGEGKEANAYFSDRQTWIEGEGGRYWIGWERGFEPSPMTLSRTERIAGRPLRLEDGQYWVVIAANDLPTQCRRVNGDWVWQPHQRFAAFVERSSWAFDRARDALQGMLRGAEVRLTGEAIDYAIEVLAWNYRITPEIVSHLGLFTPSSLMQLLAASTDLERLTRLEDELKKTGGSPVIPSG